MCTITTENKIIWWKNIFTIRKSIISSPYLWKTPDPFNLFEEKNSAINLVEQQFGTIPEIKNPYQIKVIKTRIYQIDWSCIKLHEMVPVLFDPCVETNTCSSSSAVESSQNIESIAIFRFHESLPWSRNWLRACTHNTRKKGKRWTLCWIGSHFCSSCMSAGMKRGLCPVNLAVIATIKRRASDQEIFSLRTIGTDIELSIDLFHAKVAC